MLPESDGTFIMGKLILVITCLWLMASCSMSPTRLTGQKAVLAGAIASTDGSSSPTDTSAPPDDIKLSEGPTARLDLPNPGNSTRTIEVYPTATASKKIYYHTPLLALIETSHPKPGYPATVWDAQPDRTLPDITRLTFMVRLTSIDLQNTLKQLLKNQLEIDEPSRVDMRPWPIRQISATLIYPNVSADQQILGRSDTINLAGRTDASLTINIPVENKKLPLFQNTWRDPINPPELTWSYTFENIQQRFATAQQKSTAAILQTIANSLSAQQKHPGDPIFQDQAQQIRQEVASNIQQTIVTNSPDLIPAVAIDINTILKPDTIDLTRAINTTDYAAVVGYLQPPLEKYQKSTEQREEDTHTHGNDFKIGSTASGGYPPYFQGTFTIGDEEKDELKTVNGVDVKKSEDGQYYEPYQIAVSRVATGYQAATSDTVRQAFVIAGFNDVTAPQSPLPISFTEAQALASPASAVPYAGIGLGMSFCYFGKDIPDGYVELDGFGQWPKENWVPASLQGQTVPNAKGALVGVAKRCACHRNDFFCGGAVGAVTVSEPGGTLGVIRSRKPTVDGQS